MTRKSELPKLRKRTQQTITSVLALRDSGIHLNYPLKILTALYDDLSTELDSSHNPWETFIVPPKEWREKLEDSISLYARQLVGRTSASALDEILSALANSPLGEAVCNSADLTSLKPQLSLLMQHARRITEDGLDQLMYDYQTAYLGSENGIKVVPQPNETKPIPRLHLAQPKQAEHQLFTLTDGSEGFYSALVEELKSRNVFHRARVLDYDWSALTVGVVEGLKSEKDFYGYADIKKALSRHFQKFANGELMRPLVLFGPPGTGKTQLVHTYALRSEGVTLIRASPWILDKLDEQLEYFGKFAPKKIVLFVDDLEAGAVSWSKFRGIYESGGRFQPPSNVLLAITSNDDFPENVKSRGLCLKFPNVSSPEEGYGTALGIIKDYISTIGLPSHLNQKIYAAFVVQDFYHGAVPKELAVYWAKDEKKHPYELSPRGLLQYLKNEARRGKIIPKCWEFQQRQEELSATEKEMGLFGITSQGKSSVERIYRSPTIVPPTSVKADASPPEPPSEIEFTLEGLDDREFPLEEDDKDKK